MNNKRPVAVIEDDWIKGNSDGAFKGIAMLLLLLGFICFFLGVKFQPTDFQKSNYMKTAKSTKADSSIEINESENSIKDYWSINGTIGDFTAGTAGTLFSLAGFALLYLSFRKQTEANVTQLNAYNHDKVEGRFFEMIKLHRDNVNELKFTTYHYEEQFINGNSVRVRISNDFENRHFFVAIVNQFKSAYNELDHMFLNWPEDEIYTKEYLKTVSVNQTLIHRNVDLVKYARIDLVYLIVFFGLSVEGQRTIKSLVSDKYDCTFIDKLLKIAALKPKLDSSLFYKWHNIQRAVNSVEVAHEILLGHAGLHEDVGEIYARIKVDNKEIPIKGYYVDNFEKYYGGHQFRLGHYFRHIFHTVSFINDNPDLSPTDQYNYIKNLRGQLSTNEQIMIFLNSISQLGRVWELEDKKSGKAIEHWKHLISDYMIIKNIPNDEVIPGIKLSEFYPDIVYEGF